MDYAQIEEIKEGMTYKEVIDILGPAKDFGSGLYVVSYKTEKGEDFSFSFGSWDDKIDKSGSEILKELSKKD